MSNTTFFTCFNLKRGSLILALLASAALAGCGGGGGSSGSSPAPASAASTGATEASSGGVVAISYTPTESVQISVAGPGRVVSKPAGVVCSSEIACAGAFSPNTKVTLLAEPASGYVISSWGGACEGRAPTCEVTLSKAARVFVGFEHVTAIEENLKIGTSGLGSVISSPAGIDCKGTTACSADFMPNTLVSLTAAPVTGYTFAGWSGACSGVLTTCRIAMSANKVVLAKFVSTAPPPPPPPPTQSYTLSTAVSGSGTIASSPTGLNCTGSTGCSATFKSGTAVALYATPAAGYTFASWGGACSGSAEICSVAMTEAHSVTASFTPKPTPQTLSVTLSGTGTVTSSPAGVACNGASGCSASYPSGTSVTLTAAAASGFSFSGWGGACSGSAASCTVSMSAAKSVAATFTANPKNYSLAVAMTGSGLVSSSPAGVNCNGSTGCSASYLQGTSVTLAAVPAAGYTFGGWGGACSGTAPTCAVAVNAATNVTVLFSAVPKYVLSAAISGSGSITSTPAGLTCSQASCSASFTSGTSVSLAATAASGYKFTSWSGACTGSSASCTVAMTAAKSVAAVFTAVPTTVSLQVALTGTGTVSSNPAGLSCNGATGCSASFTTGTQVTLSAAAGSGFNFGSWGGACAGSATSCTVSMSAAQSVTASFTAAPTFPLQVTMTGQGTISSAPSGLSCTGSGGCSASFASGASVMLTATAPSGSSFSTWGGACAGSSPSCTVSMSAAKAVTATFTSPIATSGAPIVLYTDLASGPLSGGENNKGVYLSVFGKNFGTTGLGTTTQVLINGAPVDNYRFLGTAKGRTDIQQITVQVGALNAPQMGKAVPVTVVVNGVTSNSNITFTPNPGDIRFVDVVSGNDSTAVKNDITHPYRHVQWSSGGALAATQPGDVIVMRQGTWQDLGYGGQWFVKFFVNSGSAPTGTKGTGPYTLMSYPTEDVFINMVHSLVGVGGALSGVNGQDYPGIGSFVTIADLRIEGGGNAGPVNLQIQSNNWRVVNNELTSATGTNSSLAGGVTGNGYNAFIVGNHIHNIVGGAALENHGIYLDGEGSYEVAYNVLETIPGGNGFQMFINGGNGSNYGGNVNLHHNLIHDVGKHGINIADGSSGGIVVFNNVVYNTHNAGLRFNTNTLSGCLIYNNTFYNSGVNGSNAILQNDWSIPNGALTMRNNIFSANGQAYTGGSVGFTAAMGTMTNNLFYGGSGGTLGTFVVAGNPSFVSSTNLHLSSTSSAALNAGSSAVSGTVTNDYDITTSRPQGGAYDIGAYEYPQ